MRLSDESFKITGEGIDVYRELETKLTASDTILLLLLIAKIKGDTKMQKQVFLAWKEIFSDVILDPVYYPHRFGAFSELVRQIVRGLTDQQLVTVQKRRGEGTIYEITDFGKERIHSKVEKLKIDLKKLEEKKADWDEWSPKGIIRYVYRKYPDYADKSVVPWLKW